MAEAPIDLEAEDLERAADTEPVEGAIAEAPDNDGGRPATVEEGGGDTNADEAAEAVVPPPNAEPEPSVAAAEEKAPEEAEIGGDGLTTPRKLTKTADPSQVLPTSVVLLNDRYEIFPSKPLPELDSPSASAFEAQDKQQEHGAIFALICLPDIPVRLNEIEQVSGETIAGIIKLLSAGSEEWPILGRWCQILIYERPLGGRVFTALENEPADFKKIDIVRAVSNQVISSILNLTMQGISHRAIRADNIFYKNDSRTEIILGDYLSAPAGFDQPLAYETIERGMALEGGRGMGNSSDDLYAFGVTLAFIVQPVSPIMGKTREQMIMSKIIHTSYQALVGRNILT
ncbi:MAG: hypothetical protein HQ503_06420 [Rhodospirillales bacterium]|nr:hypothetical protein [Rhodospirillales bacterium]